MLLLSPYFDSHGLIKPNLMMMKTAFAAYNSHHLKSREKKGGESTEKKNLESA